MQIIGHRGAAGLAAENSPAAINKAIEAGADWVEIDIRRTVDNELVLLHDRHTGRFTHQPLQVHRTPINDLRALMDVTTLEEALLVASGKIKINIEIKSRGCGQLLADAIDRARNHGLSMDNIIITSFWPHVLREVHTTNPHLRLGLLTHINVWSPFLPHRVPLSAVGFYWPLALAPFIRFARRRGLLPYAYTVNRPGIFNFLKKQGVEAIVTDYPSRFTQQD